MAPPTGAWPIGRRARHERLPAGLVEPDRDAAAHGPQRCRAASCSPPSPRACDRRATGDVSPRWRLWRVARSSSKSPADSPHVRDVGRPRTAARSAVGPADPDDLRIVGARGAGDAAGARQRPARATDRREGPKFTNAECLDALRRRHHGTGDRACRLCSGSKRPATCSTRFGRTPSAVSAGMSSSLRGNAKRGGPISSTRQPGCQFR